MSSTDTEWTPGGGTGGCRSAALWGRARQGLGAALGRGGRLRGRGSLRRLGFAARGRAAVAPLTMLPLASHAIGRGTVRCRAGARRCWGGGVSGPGSGDRGWRALRCARCLRGRSGARPRRGLRFGRERQRRVGVRGAGGGVGGSVLAGRGWWTSGCVLLHTARAGCGVRAAWAGVEGCSLSIARSLSLSQDCQEWYTSPTFITGQSRCVNRAFRNAGSSMDEVYRVNPP